MNGFDSLIITKLDVLDELQEVPVCVAYEVNGKQVDEMPATNRDMEAVRPVFERLPGWNTSTRGVSSYDELPARAKDYIAFLAARSGVEVGCVSTGPERTQTMMLAGSRLGRLLGA